MRRDAQSWPRVLALAVGLVLVLPGAAPPAGAQGAGRPFTVAAASDLQQAFTQIGQRFERQTGGKVVFSFGATGNLAKQIENGAPFDLFAAANVRYVEDLERKGLTAPGSRQVYAIGHLVLASNKRAGPPVKDLRGLLEARVRRVAIANPDHAPYGFAAREALRKAGVWEPLQPKLVLAENIRQTLQFVQTGNVEAAIIALSVASVPEITYQRIDSRMHSPLRQALAIMKNSPHSDTARRFSEFVLGPAGRAVLLKYGFDAPGKKPLSKR